MKILVLGAAGMAGHVVHRFLLGRGYDVVAHARSSLFVDVAYTEDLYLNKDALEHMITRERPQLVVNCVGVLVERSKRHPYLAAYINAYLPHYLVLLGSLYDFSTIHISTDCVFSGRDGNYHETSIKDEAAPYGLSKSLGEINNSRDCTIRTSIVGPELKPHGSGLLAWFLRQKGTIKGYTNAYWNGVTTLELAKFVDKVIAEEIVDLTNLCSSENVSKFELLQLFNEIYQHKIEIRPHELEQPINKTLIMARGIEYEQRKIATLLEELRGWYE